VTKLIAEIEFSLALVERDLQSRPELRDVLEPELRRLRRIWRCRSELPRCTPEFT